MENVDSLMSLMILWCLNHAQKCFGLYLKAGELYPSLLARPPPTHTHSPPWHTVVGNAEGLLADSENLLSKHPSDPQPPLTIIPSASVPGK